MKVLSRNLLESC